MDDISKVPSYFRYWGKAKKDPDQTEAAYHLLPYHCLDRELNNPGFKPVEFDGFKKRAAFR